MKTCLSSFLLLFISFAFAQRDDNPNNLRAKKFELSVKTIPSESLKLPFQSIKIIDSRFDTSKLGFRFSTRFLSAQTVFEKITLSPGIEEGIEKFYNEYYKNNFTSNGQILLISLKKLWINNVPNGQGENQRKDIDRLSLSRQHIYAKFEYFLGSVNAYVPLKRIDTVFKLTTDKKVEDYDPNDENKLPFFCFALEKMVENVNYERYMKELGNKKKMSIDEVQEYNATSKNIPILKEPVKKGVFLTFNEFKNNQPSVITFSKKKMLKKKIYEITDDQGNVIRNYFAYSDGEKLAIAKHMADLFTTNVSQDNFGMYKVDNSFQFFQSYRRYTYISNTNQDFRSYILVKVPRQVDMETGDIY